VKSLPAGDDDALKFLIEALKDKAHPVRSDAMDALKEI